MEHINEKSIAEDIENPAARQPDHRVEGLALIAEDIVHDTARGKCGAGDENIECIVSGIRKNGIRAAEKPHGRVHESDPKYSDDGACSQRQIKTHRTVRAGTVHVPRSEPSADVRPGAVSEHEAKSLKNRHQAEDNTGCR